jgi:hypothetical protein
MVAYLIAGVTNLLHDGWMAHSTYTLMVIAAVLSAAGGIRRQKPDPSPEPEPGSSLSEVPTSTP